jgi:hypothetical protein
MYLIDEVAELEALTSQLSKEQSERRLNDLSTELNYMEPAIPQSPIYIAASLPEAVTAPFLVATTLYLRSLHPMSASTDDLTNSLPNLA